LINCDIKAPLFNFEPSILDLSNSVILGSGPYYCKPTRLTEYYLPKNYSARQFKGASPVSLKTIFVPKGSKAPVLNGFTGKYKEY